MWYEDVLKENVAVPGFYHRELLHPRHTIMHGKRHGHEKLRRHKMTTWGLRSRIYIWCHHNRQRWGIGLGGRLGIQTL